MPPLDFGEIKEQNQAICFDNKATQLTQIMDLEVI